MVIFGVVRSLQSKTKQRQFTAVSPIHIQSPSLEKAFLTDKIKIGKNKKCQTKFAPSSIYSLLFQNETVTVTVFKWGFVYRGISGVMEFC